jgi:hypothetical protein
MTRPTVTRDQLAGIGRNSYQEPARTGGITSVWPDPG